MVPKMCEPLKFDYMCMQIAKAQLSSISVLQKQSFDDNWDFEWTSYNKHYIQQTSLTLS